MDNMTQATKSEGRPQPYPSPAAAWALAVGTSVGWGSLVVTSNTYPAQAGPLGSILGLLIGMLLIAGISMVIPFVGRTAIGWIVGVTTLGAAMLYYFSRPVPTEEFDRFLAERSENR